MKAKIVKMKGNFAGEYYAIKINGRVLRLSDRSYSSMVDYSLDHIHPKAKEFFQEIADKINNKGS